MNIIEPCCAERQLPALLREQKGRAVLFQTYGDVTFDNILKSVSSMAGNDHLTVTLAAREVTDKMQRTLQRYQDRQWITTLRVLTDDLVGEAICIEGDLGTVIIQGPIQDTAAQRGTPVLYAGQFAKADGVVSGLPADRHPLAKLLDARVRRQQSLAEAEKKALADNADGADLAATNGDGSSRDSEAVTQEPSPISEKKKKSKTTKKTKTNEKSDKTMAATPQAEESK
jgi:hypothetical protein